MTARPVSFFEGIQRQCVSTNRFVHMRRFSSFSEAAAEIADVPRQRRVRRREGIKRGQTRDLRADVERLLLEEDARWSGPTEEQIYGQTSHPVLVSLLESVMERMLKYNAGCNEMMKKVYEEEFSASRSVADYIEFRLLEIGDKCVPPIVDFFVDFGYKEENSFVVPDGDKPIYCKVLMPPFRRRLPKIILSYLQVDVDLSEECCKVLKKRMEHWLCRVDKYASTALGVVSAPWRLPDKAEYNLIASESRFAAWCVLNGYIPSAMGMSVNEMRKNVHQYCANPPDVQLSDISEVFKDSHPMNPMCSTPIWSSSDKIVNALAPVAEVIPKTLSDGLIVESPGSHIAFIDRAILPQFQDLKNSEGFTGYTDEHYDHLINSELLTFMHGCISTAILVDAQAMEMHEQVIRRAKKEGKVLTLDGSNEDDEALYKEYFKEVAKAMTTISGEEQEM